MSASKLDSITAYQTYGIHPSNLRFIVQNIFYFPPRYKDLLTQYTFQEVNTAHFVSCIEEGMIDKEGTLYQIIYHKTDPTKLKRRQVYTTVKLSFREVDPIFNIPPTVLVMEVRYKEETPHYTSEVL